MSKALLIELNNLTIEEKMIRTSLEKKYFDSNKRKKMFARLDEVRKDIQKIKFKLKMEREIRK